MLVGRSSPWAFPGRAEPGLVATVAVASSATGQGGSLLENPQGSVCPQGYEVTPCVSAGAMPVAAHPAAALPWLCLSGWGVAGVGSSVLAGSVLTGEAQPPGEQPGWSWDWCCPGKCPGGDRGWPRAAEKD